MWDSMFKCQKGGRHSEGTNNGVHLCGFDNEDLVDTLNAADECDHGQKQSDEHTLMRLIAGHSSLTMKNYKGPKIIDDPRSFKRSFSRYKSTSIKYLIQHANLQFDTLVNALCPGDPEKAAGALINSALFRMKWGLDGNGDDFLSHPAFVGLVDAYRHAEDKQAKIALLSLVGPFVDPR